jgi:hypothetical protein
MFFEPLLTGDVWWLVVNKRRRRIINSRMRLGPLHGDLEQLPSQHVGGSGEFT